MIVWHSIAIPLCIIIHCLLVDRIFTARKRYRITCIIDEVSSQIPLFSELKQPDYADIMRTILSCVKPSSLIDLINLTMAFPYGIAYLSSKTSFRLSEKQFQAIGFALAKEKLSFQILLALQIGTISEIDLITHILIVSFYRKFVLVVGEILEIAYRHLIHILRFNI